MRFTSLFVALLLATNAAAEREFVAWPDANYDPAIPTIEDVLGHRSGERITWHRDAIRYFEALEEDIQNLKGN